MHKPEKHQNGYTPWTIEHLQYLERYYQRQPLAELAAYLGRTPGAVALMAYKLGCRRKRSGVWTEREMDIIRHHYARGVRAGYLQQLLPGRSISGIFTMAEKMGVLSGRFWREEELEILKRYYPAEGTAITDRLPGRTTHAVRVMAKKLGLKKSQSSTCGFRPWSDEEWQTLERNMYLSIAEQQATLFPDRTVRAVEKARGRLLKKMDHVNHADETMNQE
jgi:hypothetical protein